jgi:hypothetical protein
MSVLKDCMTFIQASAESNTSQCPVQEAVVQCMRLGDEIASRCEKIGGSSALVRKYSLAPYKRLQALYEEFRSSVLLLHGLTQGYVATTPRGHYFY